MNDLSIQPAAALTRRIADFAGTFTLASAPERVIEHAKLATLDCLGVSILALSQEIGDATLAFARENAASGSCTIWGTGVTVSERDAAFCNGILSHGLDYDDRNHSSTFTLAAGLSTAEKRSLSGERLLEAFIAGREVRNSLDKLFSDRNSGVGPGARGWHSNGILGPIAAVCSAGNALRLDSAQMLAAIGLAAGSCGALTRDGGTMAKPFRTGHAAATGVTCALLAAKGFTADETVLEGRHGLLDALSPVPDAALQALGRDLGVRFQLEGAIKSKPLASCTATHSATEAMLRLRGRHSIDPGAVAAIECDLKPYPLVRQIPRRGFEGRFSMPFCLATALVQGRLSVDDFTDTNVASAEIQAILPLVKHTANTGTLKVILRNGTQLSESLAPPSDFTTREEIVAKFHRCTDAHLSASNAERAVDLVLRLEALPTVRELTKVLRTTSG
jgi:2-methylcitrate dehydratase PrpD